MPPIAMLVVTGLGALALAVSAARRRSHGLAEWSVGGRSFSSVMVFLLLAGENYTTFSLLGGAGWVYGKGAAVAYSFCYFPLACVIGYWLMPAIWRYAKERGLYSQSDYVRAKYDSRTLGIVVTLVGAVAMVPYLALQLKGLAIIAFETSHGAVPLIWGVIGGGALLAAYAIIGGLRGAALTSIIKDLLVLVVVLGLGVWLPLRLYGSWDGVLRAVSASHPDHLVLRPDLGFGRVWFISTVLLCAFGLYMWPHLFSSAFSAKDERSFRRTVSFAPFYSVLMVASAMIGFTALAALPALGKGDEDLAMLRLVAAELPDPVLGFVGAVGLLTALVPGAVLTTTITTSLVRDGLANLRPSLSDTQLARGAKLLVPAVVALAVGFSLSGGQTIVGLLLAGYAIVVQLFPAVIGSALPRNPLTREGVFAGLLVGSTVAVAAPFVGLDWKHLRTFLPEQLAEVNTGVVALIANLVVAYVVSRLT